MAAHIEQPRDTNSAFERRFDTRARQLPAEQPLTTALPTAIAGLDALLAHGGLPYGSLVTLCGQHNAGAGRLAEHIIRAAQQRGSLVCYVDFGGRFGDFDAEAAGVELAGLLRAQPESSAEALDVLCALAASGDAGLVVVDSFRRLLAPTGDPGLESALDHIALLLERSQTLLLGLLEPEPAVARHAALALAGAAAIQLTIEPGGAVEQHGLFGERVTITALRSRVTVTARQPRQARCSAEITLPLAPA